MLTGSLFVDRAASHLHRTDRPYCSDSHSRLASPPTLHRPLISPQNRHAHTRHQTEITRQHPDGAPELGAACPTRRQPDYSR